jgi:predicted nucleic acid-binding protein
LAATENDFAISIITHYEIFSGSNDNQNSFWSEFLESVEVLDFDMQSSSQAIKIFKQLKKSNKMIDLADIFIAATSITNNLPMATLNLKHLTRNQKDFKASNIPVMSADEHLKSIKR